MYCMARERERMEKMLDDRRKFEAEKAKEKKEGRRD
jgi:hypothetical protein